MVSSQKARCSNVTPPYTTAQRGSLSLGGPRHPPERGLPKCLVPWNYRTGSLANLVGPGGPLLSSLKRPPQRTLLWGSRPPFEGTRFPSMARGGLRVSSIPPSGRRQGMVKEVGDSACKLVWFMRLTQVTYLVGELHAKKRQTRDRNRSPLSKPNTCCCTAASRRARQLRERAAMATPVTRALGLVTTFQGCWRNQGRSRGKVNSTVPGTCWPNLSLSGYYCRCSWPVPGFLF